MPRISRSELFVPKLLPPEARAQLTDALYAVHQQVFDGVEREAFAKYVIESKAEQTWILVHKGEGGDIVGYCALHIFEKDLQGQPAAVARMEAGTLRDYRGGNTNSLFGLTRALRYLARNPGRRMFYLGSLVHPSSYSLFGKYFEEVWPRAGVQTPLELQDFMDGLATTFGLARVDPDKPLVRNVGWRTRESEMEREYWQHCDKPAARFFLEANPGYSEGHGLVTLVPLRAANLLSMAKVLFRERVQRRVEVAWTMAWRLPIGAQLLKPAEVEKRLRAVSLFAHFDEDSLAEVTQRSEIVLVPPGRYIFRQGDASDEMYLIARGAAFVLSGGEHAEQMVDELGTGAIFGEIAMLAGERRSASVRAVTSTTMVRIPKDALLPLLEADAGLRWGVWKTFTARRFDDHVRGLSRFADLGRKARMAWFEKGVHREWLPGERHALEPGQFLFVVSGLVEMEFGGAWMTPRGPVLLESQKALTVQAVERAQVILLPRHDAQTAPFLAAG